MWLPSQSRYTAPSCGMAKQMVVHLYHGILRSIHTQGTMPRLKKAYLKTLVLYSSIYVTFLKWQNYRNGKQIRGCHGLRERRKEVSSSERVRKAFQQRKDMNSTTQRIRLILSASALISQDLNSPTPHPYHPYQHATLSSCLLLC